MKHYELSPAQFALIENLLPPNGRCGGQWKEHRRILNGIFWLLHAGAQWREVPARYGKWQTVYHRFNRWRRDGTIDRMLERLHMRLDADGRIDVDLWLVDSTVIRAGAAAAGAGRKNMPRDEPTDHALGRSRGGFGTKIHLVTDSRGVPLGAVLSAGQDHDCRYARPALHSVRIKRPGAGRPLTRPSAVCGDKGYSYTSVRDYLAMRRIRAIIPTRSDQKRRRGFDKRRYKKRNAVERCVGWLKWSRRIETRHEKLAVNYLAMTKLAMIKRCARLVA